MKKALALLLSGLMIFTPIMVSAEAVAEEPLLEDAETAVDEAEDFEFSAAYAEGFLKELKIEGDYAEFNGYKIWIPAEMTKDEADEDSYFTISYTGEDFQLGADVYEDVFESLDDFHTTFAEIDYEKDPVKVNGMEGYLYVDDENDLVYASLYDDGNIVELCVTPASDEYVYTMAILLMGTIQKVEE